MKVTEGLFCAKLKDVLCIHDLILLYDILPYYCYYELLYTFGYLLYEISQNQQNKV